jgi:sterol desaturase/sphingolipid hydroxylase (fatty acid hydroxylase superfamily)
MRSPWSAARSSMAPEAVNAMSPRATASTTGLIDLRAAGFGGVFGAIAAMLIGALIFDFFNYWLHRLEHVNGALWQEHLLHHCDEYVNVTTSSRSHFLEQFLLPLFVATPMAILFVLPPVTISSVALVPVVWIHVVHLNVKFSFGRFWWLLASPQYHRIHHSLEAAHIGKNFAVRFPLWDIVFRNSLSTHGRRVSRHGRQWRSRSMLPEAIFLPFIRWAAMVRNARSSLPRHP